MLGKLIKYEWKGFRFPMLIMLIVLAGTTVLTCSVILTINPKYDETFTWYSMMALMLSVFLYYFGIIGCSVGTMLIIAIRFYKTTYTDQGYLTHTLPVETKTLLAAKTITSVLCYLLMLLGIAATLLIIIGAIYTHICNLSAYEGVYLDQHIGELFAELSDGFREEYGISFGAFVTFYTVFMIVACISAIMTVLGCVSLGQLYTKHRIIGAIIAYFAVISVQQFISYLAMLPTYSRMIRAGGSAFGDHSDV